jgi:ATP-dependent DNA helicase RecQ
MPNTSSAIDATRESFSTRHISLHLYRNGMPPEVIARERRLSISTIRDHLTRFIETGELHISQFLDEATLNELLHYFAANPQVTLSKAKDHFGERYDYWQLRMASVEYSRKQRGDINALL